MSRADARVALVTLALAGCGGGSEAADDSPAPPTCDVRALFATDGLAEVGCSGALCHSAGILHLDLESGSLEARLLDREADPEGPCAGELLVDSAAPQDSLLLRKVDGTSTCGAPMPLTNPSALTDEQVTCIEQYVRFVAAGGEL